MGSESGESTSRAGSSSTITGDLRSRRSIRDMLDVSISHRASLSPRSPSTARGSRSPSRERAHPPSTPGFGYNGAATSMTDSPGQAAQPPATPFTTASTTSESTVMPKPATTASKRFRWAMPEIPLLYRNILKCSVAYFIGSLFTFHPYLSGFIADLTGRGPGERTPSPSGHMVATV